MLFFTAPPLNVDPPLIKGGRALGHSARYLAAKAKKDAMKAAKRKADEANVEEREAAAKKSKADEEAKLTKAVSDLSIKALKALEDQLATATKTELESNFNGNTEHRVVQMLDQLTEVQQVAIQADLERKQHKQEREAARRVPVTGMTVRLEEKY